MDLQRHHWVSLSSFSASLYMFFSDPDPFSSPTNQWFIPVSSKHRSNKVDTRQALFLFLTTDTPTPKEHWLIVQDTPV